MTNQHPITRRLAHATILRRARVVAVKEHVRSLRDLRRMVDRHIVEYRDEAGVEYRKSFETRPGVAPVIPAQGTHQQLGDLAIQWGE